MGDSGAMGNRACVGLLLLFGVAWAGEPTPDAATRFLPKDSIVILRFPSAERIDALGVTTAALWKAVGDRAPKLERILGPAYAKLPIDRKRPFHVALYEQGVAILMPLVEGTTEVPPLVGGRPARLAGTHALMLEPELVAKAARAQPAPMLPGDFAAVFEVRELVERNAKKLAEARKWVEEFGAKELAELPVELPPVVVQLARAIARLALETVDGADSIHYALTEKDGDLFSEGWLRTRPDSALREFMTSLGAPKPHRLAGYLPPRAFFTVDTFGIGSALDRRVAGWLDASLGEGAGADLMMLLGPSYALAEHLDGRGAGAIHVTGLGTAAMRSVWGIREGAPIDEAIRKLDAARVNRRLRELGAPVQVQVQLDAAKLGETSVHRIVVTSPMRELAMIVPQLNSWFCIEKGMLLTTQSMNGLTDLRGLVARVREGGPGEHEHLAQMERLGLERHEGLTIDWGALKPTLGFAAMFAPELMEPLQHLPDSIPAPTALRIENGHAHLRGSWPLAAVLEFVGKLR